MTLQVFISYKSEYREIAREVKQRIHTWGYKSWLDVDEIPDGSYFRFEIDKGLKHSDAVVGIITQEAQESREVLFELDFAIKKNKLLVLLKYRDCELLYHLESIQWIDFTKDPEEGFERLHKRLSALAAVAVKPDTTTAPPAEPEPMREEAMLDDFLSEKSEQKKEILEEGLFGVPDLSTADAPKPQPAPPQPIISPSLPGSVPSLSNTPVMQPARQQEYVPQPPALGRKRSSPILLPLAAVASLIIVVGAVVLFGSSAAISTTTQFPEGTSPLVWIGLVAVVGAVGVLGWWRFRRSSAVPDAQTEAANRATMLQNVEDFWLKGVLDPALEAGTFEMGLSSAPGVVLRHKDYGDYELPANANILDVFNDLNRELLILGAPGGGKTVLLLQLAKELIQQAREDVNKAIPVVFNLSSWAAERKPLGDWLMDELRQKYQVPMKTATAWVEGEKLLLLLDGLDEVAEQYRNECVDAINTFRQKYRIIDLAICSRIADYDALTNKLDVRGAIVLEPLNQRVVDRYLDRPELASLRQVMREDKELQEMSQVPFLLNAMAYAYVGTTLNNLQFPASDEPAKARRTHLFDRWVEKRLKARPNAEYTPTEVRRWLEWLAVKMIEFKQTTFYIEGLQPSWLSKKNIGLYQLTDEIVFVLNNVIWIAILGGLLGIIFNLSAVIIGLSNGLILGTLLGLCIRLYDWLPNRGKFDLVGAGKDVSGLTGRGGFEGKVTGSKSFRFPAKELYTPRIEIESVKHIETSTKPNEIIVNLTSSALLKMFISTLLFGTIFTLHYGLFVGIIVGIIFSVLAIIQTKVGKVVIKHYTLRLILWRSDIGLWNYARFLDYCVSTGLMRKVGGGYIFAHRYLLEYFAELDVK